MNGVLSDAPVTLDPRGDEALAGPLDELTLHRRLDLVIRNHSAERLLDSLLDVILDTLALRFGLLGHVSPDGDLRVLALRPVDGQTAAAPATTLLVEASAWQPPLAAVRLGRCQRATGPLPLPGGFDGGGPFAAAPLVQQGRLLGLLLVGPRQGGGEHDLDLLNAAASRAAPVVEATLHRAAERRTVSALQLQLVQAQRMEAIGRLAGGIAHDFNNQLTAILGYCHLMAVDLAEGTKLGDDLQQIRQAADHAAALTRQLLTFARGRPGQTGPVGLVDLNEILEGLAPMLQRLLAENIELSSDLAPNLGRVRADPTELERVLVNLVVNAKDAMPDGGRVRLRTRNLTLDRADDTMYHGLAPGDYVQLSVTDTGEGMDAETRLRVFEPFFSTKPAGRGTGLGLATVYGVVKQAGGEIWIDSEPGQGSCFRICLPRDLSGTPGDGAGSRRPRTGQSASPYCGSETVLLVEDDDQVLRLTRRILEGFGYQVLSATDGVTALRLATGHHGPIHALVTDVVLPGVSGPRLAAALAGLHPHTRVLYLSGHPNEELSQHIRPADSAPLLTKPFKPIELARALRRLLDAPAA
jgi:signal transduction histidine kinase